MPVGPSILWPVKAEEVDAERGDVGGRCGTSWEPSTSTRAPARMSGLHDRPRPG